MKTARFDDAFGLENLHFHDVPDPVAGPGQAIVRVRACSLNYRDLLVAKGAYGRAVKPPLVPLSDGAGEVVAIGEGVTRVKPGDRVCGCFFQNWIEGEINDEKGNSAMGGSINGMLSEKVCLGAEGITKFPDHLSFEEAATLPCAALTAWNALFVSGRLKPGDTVLIQGSGGVSVFALQFAKMTGARVIATSSHNEKLDRMKQMGAEALVNYKTTPEWDKAARDFTGGAGVDHIVEVGGAGTLSISLKAVRRGGHIAMIGVLSGQGEADPRMILLKSVRVQGIYVGSRVMFEDMNGAIEASQLHPVIDRVFDFDKTADALRYMESASHFGKICIRL